LSTALFLLGGFFQINNGIEEFLSFWTTIVLHIGMYILWSVSMLKKIKLPVFIALLLAILWSIVVFMEFIPVNVLHYIGNISHESSRHGQYEPIKRWLVISSTAFFGMWFLKNIIAIIRIDFVIIKISLGNH
jgi:hypothetical protein